MEAICNGFLKPLPIKWLNSKNCIQAKTRKDACGGSIVLFTGVSFQIIISSFVLKIK